MEYFGYLATVGWVAYNNLFLHLTLQAELPLYLNGWKWKTLSQTVLRLGIAMWTYYLLCNPGNDSSWWKRKMSTKNMLPIIPCFSVRMWDTGCCIHLMTTKIDTEPSEIESKAIRTVKVLDDKDKTEHWTNSQVSSFWFLATSI